MIHLPAVVAFKAAKFTYQHRQEIKDAWHAAKARWQTNTKEATSLSANDASRDDGAAGEPRAPTSHRATSA
jgi:hypothetical protein